MKDAKREPFILDDILLDQIVEDEDGNMHIVREDRLMQESRDGGTLLRENDLAVYNMENDFPYTDLTPDSELSVAEP